MTMTSAQVNVISAQAARTSGIKRSVCKKAPGPVITAAEVVVVLMSAAMTSAVVPVITAAEVVVVLMSAAMTFAVLLATIVVTA